MLSNICFTLVVAGIAHVTAGWDTINFRKYCALKEGKSLTLSPREYEILKCLIERQGEIVSRDDLLNQVWGYYSFPNTRTVDAHIAKIRRKIEDKPEEPKLIITIHGIGYKFIK